jgi:hypothetical protein
MIMDPSFAADFIKGIMVDDHDHTISPNFNQYPDLAEFYVPSLGVENPFLQPDLCPTSFAPSITAAPSAADSLTPPSMGACSGGDSSSEDC